MRNVISASIGVGLAMGLSVGMAQTVAPTQPLNDTGVRKCVNVATNTFSQTCSGPNIPPGQDGFYGRDQSYPDTVDGVLGFSFTKICNSGEPAGTGSCPVAPLLKLGPGANEWGCTQDNVTGLIWEIKTSGGLRGKDNSYTNLGNGLATDASGFVKAVNSRTLCGANDWRLPTVTELFNIVNSSTGEVADVKWFPNSQQDWYWTSDGDANDASYAWGVQSTGGGYVAFDKRIQGHFVRLVRAGQ